jgi:hypothetical protein
MRRYAVILIKSSHTTVYVEAENEDEAYDKVDGGDYDETQEDWETVIGPDVDEVYPVDENDQRIWEDEE